MQLRNLSLRQEAKKPNPQRIRLFRIRMCCGGPAQASCGVPVPLNGLSILLQHPEVVACDGPAGIRPHADLHAGGGAVGRGERARNFP